MPVHVMSLLQSFDEQHQSVTNNRRIRGGCVLAAFFLAVSLFAGAEQVGNTAVTNVTKRP
jgi:hypothetical protein